MSLLFQSLAGRPTVGLLEGEHRVTLVTPSGLQNARLDSLQVFLNGALVTRIDNIENNLAQAVWPVARTISLAGPFTGSVSIDGSQDVTLTVSVPNNALSTSTISGLDSRLAGIESDLITLVDDITAVQNGLSGKVNIGDTVDTALRLATARNFTIGGVVSSGTVSFDGTGNVVFTTTIADDALSISKVSGLANALASKLESSLLGVPNGIATLDSSGRVPLVQVPPIFDDVLEFNTFAAFPTTGESGKIYIDLDTGDVFRWSGSAYANVGVASSIANAALKWLTARTISLAGKASGSVALDGSADATLNVTALNVTKADVGLGNVDNTSDLNKPISNAVVTALNAKADLESPTFTGQVGVPTAPLTSNNQTAASTAYVNQKIVDLAPSKVGLGASGIWGIDISGLAARATILNTARSFSLEGTVVSTTADFDGSGNVVLTTTVPNGALTIAKTSGLSTALAAKLESSEVGVSVAPLVGGKVPVQYIEDQGGLSEYASLANFPATGMANRLYLDRSNDRLYRWSVNQYIWVASAANTAVSAQTADRWGTPRTLTVSGKVGGVTTFDGSGNISLDITQLSGTKEDVGLSNVDNTSDLSKPISTATQAALNLKADLASPTFTGAPRAPTATLLTNDTQIATTAYATAKVEDYAPSKLGAGASGTWGISISGTAALAGTLATSRNFSISGAVTAAAVAFNGNGDVVLNTTLTDGARGEITVASAGTNWTINNGAVTLAKIANIAATTILGNNTGSAAAPIALTATQARTVLGLGTAATVNTGTSGATIPLLNGALTWSGANIFSSSVNFNGAVGQGGVPVAGRNFVLNSNIAGATTAVALTAQGPIQSAVTVAAGYYQTTAATQAAAFTLPQLTHFNATQGTFGAGSTVTLQQGFVADATMIGGGTNYGFRGRIPSGTNRWNLFMDGTADNAIAGNLRLGSTTAPTATLDVTGNAIVSGTLTVAGSAVSTVGHTHVSTHITDSTLAGRTLLTAVDAAAQRTALSLGNAALATIGTSGTTVPYLDGANFWSAEQSFSAGLVRRVTGGGWMLSHQPAAGGPTRGGIWSTDTATLLSNADQTATVSVASSGAVAIAGNALTYNGTAISLLGHTHTASQITDFNTAVQNILSSLSLTTRFRVVTAGETLGLVPVMAVLSANADFPLPTTFEAGERFFLGVAKQSAAGVTARIVVAANQTIFEAGPGNDISLSPGEAVHLLATSNNTLEILV